MGITNEIRKALKKAHGPMTTSEIRDAIGNDYTNTQIAGNVKSLVIAGEVIRDTTAEGFTYLLDPNYTPKRSKAIQVGEPSATPKQPPQQVAAAAAPSRKERSLGTLVAKMREAVPPPSPTTIKPADAEASVMPRKTMRQLVLAIVALHPEPMTPELKEAVMFAMHASL